MQMIILYKDPNGDSLKDTMTTTYTTTNGSSTLKSPSSEEWEQKVVSLEKKLSEREELIDKMKREIEQKVS